MKAQAGVLATDSLQAARDRLDAALSDLVPVGQSERFSDALRPLLGLPGSPLSTEDAESAWRRFLLALAGRGPTVLVFEDLHWADDRMIRFVELIGATVRDVPLLVVCTARPELVDREPTWAGAVPGMLSISLTPLRDDSIATLYEQMFAEAHFPPELLAPLVELADGIPLYAHEYGRMLVERGTLRRSEDTWTMEPSAELPMPRSVHAVIANRIDLLDPAERAVLQAAAVVGPRFWPGAVAAALGTGTDSVERALRTLAQRDLVREQPDSTMADEPEFRFRHVLVSDVCYERLPLAERIARHTRAADWLDARVDGRGTELADVVAHHRFTAHSTARALGLDAGPYAAPALAALLTAGRRAAMVNAYDVAATQVARANELIAAGAHGVGRPRPARGGAARHRAGPAPGRGGVPDRGRADPAGRAGHPALPGPRPRRRGPGLDPARPDRLARQRPAGRAALPGPRGRALRQLAGHAREGPDLRRAGPAAHAQLRARAGARRGPDRGRDRRPARPGRAAGQRPDHHGHVPVPGRRSGRPGRPAGLAGVLPGPPAAERAPGRAERRVRAPRGGRPGTGNRRRLGHRRDTATAAFRWPFRCCRTGRPR